MDLKKIHAPLISKAITCFEGGRPEFAEVVNISKNFAYQLENGIRPAPIGLCYKIELATNGLVTRKELRPNDWQDIWPDLAEAA